MSLVLISLIIVALIIAIAFWYITKDYRSIPDDRIINLATEEDRILNNWYAYHLKPIVDFNQDDGKLAARFLERIHQIQVDPDLLIIGKDLDIKYFRLKRSHLIASDKLESNVDQIFDLRKMIGISMQIAIIHNSQDRRMLNKYHSENNSMFYAIMDQELDLIAWDYLRKVLKYRWEKIIELNDPNLINTDGSYAYLRKFEIPNIESHQYKGMHRINLLCTDLEFETLIQRWRKSLNNITLLDLS